MDQNKPELRETNTEDFTLGQRLVLKILKWTALTASAVAMIYSMQY